MKMRDEFSAKLIRILADRAGHQCSNPGCGIYTIGPEMKDSEGVIRISVASHITAAAKGGPRFDPKLTTGQRKSIDNAIHLCASCGRLVDANGGKDYPMDMLFHWKKEHEAFINDRITNPSKHRKKSGGNLFSHSAGKIMQRSQQFEDDFLLERDRSFSGNFQEVMERQRTMGDLLNAALRDLKSELVFFPSLGDCTRNILLAALTVMRLYRLACQTTNDGALFWGAEAASQATLDMSTARMEFRQTCKELREKMRSYLG